VYERGRPSGGEKRNLAQSQKQREEDSADGPSSTAMGGEKVLWKKGGKNIPLGREDSNIEKTHHAENIRDTVLSQKSLPVGGRGKKKLFGKGKSQHKEKRLTHLRKKRTSASKKIPGSVRNSGKRRGPGEKAAALLFEEWILAI